MSLDGDALSRILPHYSKKLMNERTAFRTWCWKRTVFAHILEYVSNRVMGWKEKYSHCITGFTHSVLVPLAESNKTNAFIF